MAVKAPPVNEFGDTHPNYQDEDPDIIEQRAP
jgi:hypothetical protein